MHSRSRSGFVLGDLEVTSTYRKTSESELHVSLLYRVRPPISYKLTATTTISAFCALHHLAWLAWNIN